MTAIESAPIAASSLHAFTVHTTCGPVHLARCGQGQPVLMLHQTPRSWREFEWVMPLLAGRYDCLAMDTVGYGDTPPFDGGEPTLERWAQTALALMDALGHPKFAVVGHHTGAAIGMEIAARAPGRVRGLVLSSCPFVDAARRASHGHHPVVDSATSRADGGHLLDLWRMRQPFYPAGDVRLLERFVADALLAGPRAGQGHLVVNRYHMEARIGLVQCPTLIVGATHDPHAFPAVPRLVAAIAHARRVDIEGGMVPLPEQMPQKFAEVIAGFLERLGA